MEQSELRWAAVIVISLVGTGCGDFKFPAGSGAVTSAAEKGPGRVIEEFLEAVRTGDDQRVASLLTPLARQRTAEMQMVVAPPGSDTAKFQLRDVELVADGAHVSTDWTDLDTDGHARTDRIIWILRRNAEGWHIAGMATPLFADQAPIVLNFEDPADMLRKQQQAEEELARRDRLQKSPEKDARDAPTRVLR